MPALTESIVLAQQHGGMMEDSLEELQQLTKSKAAWFRLIEGGHLVATHAVGVSSDFLREAGFAELTETVSKILERSRPVVAEASEAIPEDAGLLASEKLRYVSDGAGGREEIVNRADSSGECPGEETDGRGTGFSGDLRTAVRDCDRELPTAGAGVALAAAVAQHV